MSGKIVLTGAAGNTGQVIAAELLRRRVPFVAMTHSAESRERLISQGIEAVWGNFDDPTSLDRALAGADQAYLVCTPDEKLVERETAFIAAAARVGVRHLVKCSAFWAGIDAETQNLRSHGLIEKALVESGIPYTIIRPHGYMQTFTLFAWDMVRKAGVISQPGADGGLPLVDVRNVAAVAVKALTELGHEGKAYDVTGPEVLNFYQIAEILGRVLNRRVTYLPGGERELVSVLKLLGVTEAPTEHTIKIFRLQREHKMEFTCPTLQELGIEPITYEQFARDLVAGRTGGGNSFRPPDTLAFRAIGGVMPLFMRARLALLGARAGSRSAAPA